MNKRDYKTMVATTIVCLIPIIFGVFVYDKLPEQVAIHWNAVGNADGYANKIFAVILLPVILAIVNVVLQMFVYNDPKRKNISKKMAVLTIWTIPFVAIVMQSMTLLIALGVEINIAVLTPLAIGAILMIMGNYMPKCKMNYTVGIRLPWTLANEDVWNKTHRLAGFIYVLSGMVIIINTLLLWVEWLLLIIVMIVFTAAVPTIYAFILYKKLNK